MVRHVLNVDLAFIGHEANNREDDEAGKDARGTVGAGYNESVPGGRRQEFAIRCASRVGRDKGKHT